MTTISPSKQMPRPKLCSSLAPSSRERLRRMGLLDDSGTPSPEVLTVLCRVYAGQLLDDMYSSIPDAGSVRTAIEELIRKAEHANPKQRLLLICLQYDSIYRPLPDPIWWVVDDPALEDAYSTGYIACLRQLLEGGDHVEEC